MSDNEALYIDCSPHGKRVAAVVCRHMIESCEPAGFVENSSDPNDLQTWCEKCEEVFSAEGDKTEEFDAFNDRAIVCCVCYSELKAKHSEGLSDGLKNGRDRSPQRSGECEANVSAHEKL